MKKNQGFTIVELLVVIVVIGILAAITMISFGNIQRRARIASIQAELKSASNLISVDYVNGSDTYPEDIGDINNGRGLNIPGYTLMYTTANGYCLSAVSQSDSSLKYRVSSDNSGSVEEGGCEKTWKQIASGGLNHTCGIGSDNLAYCWGNNSLGQVGDGTNGERLSPVRVSGGALGDQSIKFITTGRSHTCVIAFDDNAYCWGDNAYGQLGDGKVSGNSSNVPVAVSKAGLLSGKTIKYLTTGWYYTCAIASDDQAYCWGYNWHGQLGINSKDTGSSHTTPSAVRTDYIPSGSQSFKAISGGYYHVCAIAGDDKLYCWGNNYYGELGSGVSEVFMPHPVDSSTVLNGKIMKSISAGYYHTCATDSTDNLYCWGGNSNGELGDGSETQKSTPVAITSGALSGKTAKAVVAGMYHTCAISSDDNALCWGYRVNGQLGDGSVSDHSNIPISVIKSGAIENRTIKSLSKYSAYHHTCVIASNNKGYCWGTNGGGQLGNGLKLTSSTPVPVQSPPE